MDASSTNRMATSDARSRRMRAETARWWWAWIISGILWILAAVFILQFRDGSVPLVGIIMGVMFLVAGVEEFVTAAIANADGADGWQWLRIVLGILLVFGGLFALFNPVGTFIAIADTLGFLLVLVGVFWVMDAFARHVNTETSDDLWWLGLIAGFMMIGLGFWAGGQFLFTRAYTLLIFAGVWALVHGVTDIIKAFAIRKLGAEAVA